MFTGIVRAGVRLSASHPVLLLSIWMLGILWCAGLSRGLQVDADVSAFLDTDSGEWSDYEYLVRAFGSDGFVTIVIPCERSRASHSLASVAELSRGLAELKGVSSVESLATYKRLRRLGDSAISVQPLLSDGRLCDGCGQIASSDPYLVNAGLVSRQGGAVGIVVRLADRGAEERSRTIRAVDELVRASAPRSLVSGVPVFRDAILSRTLTEFRRLGPIACVVIAGVVLLAIRSLVAVLCGLACGLASIAVVTAVMAATGIPLSLTTFTLPAILLALGVAYSLHVFTAWSCGGGYGPDLVRAGALTVLSGGTTAAGFVAMSAVPVPAIRDFGTLGGLGVAVIVLAATTLVPAMLGLCRRAQFPLPLAASVRVTSWCRGISTRFPMVVVFLWILALAAGCVGLRELKFESDVIAWFPRGERIRDDYEAIRTRVFGITPLSFVFQAEEGSVLASPGAVSSISSFVEFIREEPSVGGALGYTDLLRIAYEELADSDGLPDSSGMISQLLLLLRSDDVISRLLTRDLRSAQVIVRLDANGSKAVLGLAERAEKWWLENSSGEIELTSTGIMFEYARAQEAISANQLRGLGFAAFMIALILFASCRDRVVLLAVFCSSVVPVIVLYGAFGLVGMVIDAATVSVAAVALGIAVDDSVHIAGQYGGFDGIGVPCASWSSVGPVLLVSTVVICAGFGCLALSSFAIVWRLGVVTASVVALCLVSDLTLLPALLKLRRN